MAIEVVAKIIASFFPGNDSFATTANANTHTTPSREMQPLQRTVRIRSIEATMDRSHPRFSPWPTVSVVLGFLAVAAPLAIHANIWRDEAYSLLTTSKDLPSAAYNAVTFERQAPFYFVLLWFWRIACHAPEFARLLSVACIAATIALSAAISRRFYPRLHPAWLPALLASSPVAMFAALETRVYALALLLSSLLILLFADAFLATVSRPFVRVAFVGVAVVSLYTYYYLGFLLSAAALALILMRRWCALLRYASALAAVAMFSLPLLLWLPQQVRHPSPSADTGETSTAIIRTLALRTEAYLIPPNQLVNRLHSEPAIRTLRWTLRASAVLALVLLLRRRRSTRPRSNDPALFAIWVFVVMVAIQFATAAVMLGGHLVADRRYSDILLVPCLLALLSLLLPFTRRVVPAVLLLAILPANASELWLIYQPPFAKTGDGKRVAAYIMQQERPGEAVAVFPNEDVLVFDYYYRGVNPLFGIPRPVPLDRCDPRQSAFATESELVNTVAAHAPHHRRLWLVRDRHESYLGVDYRVAVLERFLEKYYHTVNRVQFVGSELLLLQPQ